MTAIKLSMDDFRIKFSDALDNADFKYDNITAADSDKLKGMVLGAMPEGFDRESYEFGVKAGSFIQGELTRRGTRAFAERMKQESDMGYLELKMDSGLGRHTVSLARPDTETPTDEETRALVGSCLSYTDVDDAVLAIDEITADLWKSL